MDNGQGYIMEKLTLMIYKDYFEEKDTLARKVERGEEVAVAVNVADKYQLKIFNDGEVENIAFESETLDRMTLLKCVRDALHLLNAEGSS
jgi:DNA-binding protein